MVAYYEKPIKAKNNLLISGLTEKAYVFSSREISSIIIRNALDNANKYTSDGEIRIRIEKNDKEVNLFIEDNGKGFDDQRLHRLLNDQDNESFPHTGFKIIHDFAKQIGVNYGVTSTPGSGTSFKLTYSSVTFEEMPVRPNSLMLKDDRKTVEAKIFETKNAQKNFNS